VLQIAKLTSCPFTVKSGGHAAFAGGSSIQDGILINLAKMNEVTLSKDRQTTRVGPGNVWSGVYKVLDSLGVSVVGGREAGVGVGGLTLGGEFPLPS
jgi:FAD/FMN-containing dehydrogenase